MNIDDFLNDFSAFVTVISSLIAIAAVTLCSILSSYISQRGAKKTKQLELIFHEKISAYYDYLKTSSTFSDPYNTYQITVYMNAFDRASLFASLETYALMENHRELVTKTLIAKINQSIEATNKLALETSKIQAKLVHSMRKDIRK